MHFKVLVLTVAFATLTSHAVDTSVLEFQVSTDGVRWTSNLEVGPRAQTVQCRLVVSYRTDSLLRPVGLASLFIQPVVSHWARGDQLLPFASFGTNTEGGAVPDLTGVTVPFGRISPFASTGPGESDPYVGHLQNVRGTPYLRIARNSITNWVGEGPTTGAGAANNTNGSGGLAISQRAFGNVTPEDPPFRSGSRDVVVFKFAMLLESGGRGRTMSISAPEGSLTRDFQTGERVVSWYANLGDTFGQTRTTAEIRRATIVVVPTPGLGVMSFLGLCCLARRKRA